MSWFYAKNIFGIKKCDPINSNLKIKNNESDFYWNQIFYIDSSSLRSGDEMDFNKYKNLKKEIELKLILTDILDKI